METSRDVIFDEDVTFIISKKNHTYEVHDEEPKAPRGTGTDAEEHDPEDHDMAKPQKTEYPLREMIIYEKRPAWACEIIQDAKKHGALDGSLRESKRPCTYSNTWHCYSKSLMQNLPIMMKQLRRKYGRT
jgi:hypothetical protein